MQRTRAAGRPANQTLSNGVCIHGSSLPTAVQSSRASELPGASVRASRLAEGSNQLLEPRRSRKIDADLALLHRLDAEADERPWSRWIRPPRCDDPEPRPRKDSGSCDVSIIHPPTLRRSLAVCLGWRLGRVGDSNAQEVLRAMRPPLPRSPPITCVGLRLRRWSADRSPVSDHVACGK
jgi:hypothetical protein